MLEKCVHYVLDIGALKYIRFSYKKAMPNSMEKFMENKNLYCLVRNLDNPQQEFTNIGIKCKNLFERVKKGEFGDRWQIEESVINPLGGASLLRVIARSLPNGGVEIVRDRNFEKYFEGTKTPVPECKIIGPIFQLL